MRVTLSYFVEPSPGRVGWDNKHRYQSHGLRFDVIRPTETLNEFLPRVSRAEWDDPKNPKSRPDTVEETRDWTVGEDGRTHGSIHSDWWTGTAADLAASGHLAVYPVTGWWRERSHLGRVTAKARYSLIISIETPKTTTDLYGAIEVSSNVVTEVLV